MEISPKFLMKLIDQVDKKIWDDFSSYKNVRNYIKKWHQTNESNNFNDYWENFRIYEDNSKINLNETLHNMKPEIVVKIAVDLGIETPGFIPSVPIIKNVLKDGYANAFNSFQQALKQVEENPDLAVGSANSTLESIIKHILENDNISINHNPKDTLYDLTQGILKEFALFPNQNIPNEIKHIGSGLLKVSKSIEQLRSEKTTFHGKTSSDYIIKEPLYAYFIVNVVSTVGLFLMSFYERKYKDTVKNAEENNEIGADNVDAPSWDE